MRSKIIKRKMRKDRMRRRRRRRRNVARGVTGYARKKNGS